MNKLMEELRETDLKIQKGESVNSNSLNRLWNYKLNNYWELSLIRTMNKDGLKFKFYPIKDYIMRCLLWVIIWDVEKRLI